ncbi:methyltransferase domain-containing protein [Adhaeribacter rhizoryzae]|uniref:Methyltransferase domain-containing protein n=2 Tax=Adhaeribacter rhizoryzae TaxID=2607907 RepID=A0A5M6DCA4_9BACT|nr:methyltransferase domain-containing protein [Adhaeribacter rhizoryzae]
MDDLNLSGEALRKNLDELEIINHWLGGNKVVTSALNKVIREPTGTSKIKPPIKIADIGCGGGDILRVVAQWAKKHQLSVELTGIDANDFMVNYARQKCRNYANINILQENIFEPTFQGRKFDVIICSLFCHHFTDEQLQNMWSQLYRQANKAVIINDLHRHPLAYYSIKYITKLFSGSYLVKNDAPLSVLRAFRKAEIQVILAKSNINKYTLQWQWAFRWQLIMHK